TTGALERPIGPGLGPHRRGCRADCGPLEDHQLYPRLLPGVRDCAHGTQALQRDRLLVAGDLRPVSLWTGQGRVQSIWAAQTNRLRVALRSSYRRRLFSEFDRAKEMFLP